VRILYKMVRKNTTSYPLCDEVILEACVSWIDFEQVYKFKERASTISHFANL